MRDKKSGFVILTDKTPNEPETFYDDEEFDPNAPNPGRDNLKIPDPFDYDDAV